MTVFFLKYMCLPVFFKLPPIFHYNENLLGFKFGGINPLLLIFKISVLNTIICAMNMGV